MRAAFVFLIGLCLGADLRAAKLEAIFQDPDCQFTGIALSAGRIFLNYPRWQDPHKYDVVELMPDGTTVPFPSPEWNSWKPGEDGRNKWVCVQALWTDDRGFLWVVDPASPGFAGVVDGSNKLVKIDPKTNSIARVYSLAGVAGPKSYINDVRVDNERQIAYLTNSSEGGIVVLDLNTGVARQVLQDSPSVKSDPSYHFTIDGRELTGSSGPAKINSDGLELSRDGTWLYFKPLTDAKLHRVKTEDLRNADLNPAELASRVEDLGSFCTTDGMMRDRVGNLYLGDIEKSAIVRLTPEMKMETLIQDPRLIWPDSYALSDDGALYITSTQINRMPRFNDGKDRRTSPYTVYRLKLD